MFLFYFFTIVSKVMGEINKESSNTHVTRFLTMGWQTLHSSTLILYLLVTNLNSAKFIVLFLRFPFLKSIYIRNIVSGMSKKLIVFALFVSIGMCKTNWNDKYLDDWNNGWDVNAYGEPIDPETACDGNPCIRRNLIKPLPVSKYDKENFCRTHSNGIIDCNYLPEDAILVDSYENWLQVDE